MNIITKGLLGAAVLLGIAAPIAFGATAADAATVQPNKATGTVGFHYTDQGYDITGTVVFSANDKTGGTIAYTDSLGQTINGTVIPGTVHKDGNKATFEGDVISGSASFVGQHYVAMVVDGSTSGAAADQIGLYVQRDRVGDSDIAAVTSGNLSVF